MGLGRFGLHCALGLLLLAPARLVTAENSVKGEVWVVLAKEEPGEIDAKLKELAVNYTFTRGQLGAIGLRNVGEVRVGLIGRNLFTITKYSGLDPEVSGLYGDPFQVRMDWFQYPQFRTFSAVVEITY